MGRNAQPINLLVAQGKKNLTKAEIEERKKSEIKLGSSQLNRIKVPDFIKDDIIAFKYWKQYLKEYKDAAKQNIEILSSSDVGMLALYCKTYAEYERLLKSYQSIDNIIYDSRDLENYLDDSEEFDYKVKNQLRSIIAIDGLLRIETAINKKMDMLIKMQDRLFLNPLAKVKNIPKPTKEEPRESKFDRMFGDV